MKLRARLEPANLLAVMAFAGLYQMTHEMIKHQVLEQVREFYCFGFDEKGTMRDVDIERYNRSVLSLAPKNKFLASLRWLVQSDAITQAQADRLDAIYAHRHELSHELPKYIVDVEADLDVDLFSDAVAILKDLHRFWIGIELSTGGFFLPDGSVVDDIEPDDVTPTSLILLQQCINAYVNQFANSPTSP